MVEDEVVQHDEAGDAREEWIDEVVGGAVSELIDHQVEGLIAVRREKVRHGPDPASCGQPFPLDLALIVKDLDLVKAGEEGQDLGAVVGDPGGRGRERAQEREAHGALTDAATRRYSRGP